MAAKVCSPWIPETDRLRLAVLGKLLEELNEAGAIVARCIIQGVDESEPVTEEPNRAALENELADVIATVRVAVRHFDLNAGAIETRIGEKLLHFARWHELIEDCPTCGRPLGGSFPLCTDCQVVEAMKAGI